MKKKKPQSVILHKDTKALLAKTKVLCQLKGFTYYKRRKNSLGPTVYIYNKRTNQIGECFQERNGFVMCLYCLAHKCEHIDTLLKRKVFNEKEKKAYEKSMYDKFASKGNCPFLNPKPKKIKKKKKLKLEW